MKIGKNIEKIITTIGIIGVGGMGFLAGSETSSVPQSPVVQTIPVSESIVVIERIEGDQIHLQKKGNVRILLNEKSWDTPEIQIPIGQIPDENDTKLTQFKYLGNAKTKKFYPALSYPARGTEFRYRRFFQTKEDALNAGFIASKLVK